MAGPLEGVTVIEMNALGPVPLAGQLLADLGAHVIVIDRKPVKPDPKDINRRGKSCIALDLKMPDGLEAALQIIETADMLIEGFRPGVMERLGLGPEELLARNPALVIGRMTGWGQDGPLANTAGHDINYLSITGLLHAIGLKDKPPVPPLNLAADYAGGTMVLIMGLLAALIERQTSGKGQVIDAAMCEGAPALAGLIHSMLARGQWVPKRQSNLLDGGAPFYRTYETADKKYIALGALEPQFFAEFVRLAGLDDAEVASQYDRSTWVEKHARYEALFKQKTRDEWWAIFQGSDACVSPVLDFEEAAAFEHNQMRGVFAVRDGALQTNPVPNFSRSKPELASMGDATGKSTFILEKAGFEAGEIARLRKSGALTGD